MIVVIAINTITFAWSVARRVFPSARRASKSDPGSGSPLTRDDPRVDDDLRGFLGRAYNLKAVAESRNSVAGPLSRPPPCCLNQNLCNIRRMKSVPATGVS